MQTSLVVAISALVGLASAGLVWFGTGFAQRMQIAFAQWQHTRKEKAAAKAAEAAAAEPPKEPVRGRK
jgi:hypothetical protein